MARLVRLSVPRRPGCQTEQARGRYTKSQKCKKYPESPKMNILRDDLIFKQRTTTVRAAKIDRDAQYTRRVGVDVCYRQYENRNSNSDSGQLISISVWQTDRPFKPQHAIPGSSGEICSAHFGRFFGFAKCVP